MKKFAAPAALLAAMLPALVPLVLILKHGVNFPYWDEFGPDIAGMYIKAHEPQLTFADLPAQHKEHRILIPRIAYLVLNHFAHLNTVVETIAEWAIVLLTSLGLLWLFKQTQGTESRSTFSPRTIFAFFLCNLLIFTPAAWENWMLGIGLANVMPMAFIVGSFIVIGSSVRPWTKTIAAIALAGAASYSSGNGVLVWPLAGMLLVWPATMKSLRERKWIIVSWCAAFVLLMSLYFVHYQKPTHGGIHPYATSIGPALIYIPIFLGSPFAFVGAGSPHTLALVIGIILLLLLAAMLIVFIRAWRSQQIDLCRRMLVWFAVGGFGLLSAVMAAMSRAGMGVDQPLTSCRYVSFAIYLPVALVQLLALCIEVSPPRFASVARAGFMTFAVANIVIVSLTWPDSFEQSRRFAIQLRKGKAALLLCQILPDNPLLPQLVHPDLELTLRQSKGLNDIGYMNPPLVESTDARNIRESESPQPSAQGRLDRMYHTKPGYMAATGWAISNARPTPADTVILTYDTARGEPIIFTVADVRLQRDDLAAQFGDDYAYCGWLVEFPLARIPQDLPRTTIAAWAFNTDTGKAVKLHGTISMTPTGQRAPRETSTAPTPRATTSTAPVR
jgi:hypothetical protein